MPQNAPLSQMSTRPSLLVDLGAAIAGIVALRTAHVVFIELLVGIVDTVERRGVDGLRTRRTPVRPLRGPIRLSIGDGETNSEGAAE